MALYGQTTATGTRAQAIFEDRGVCAEIAVGIAGTIDYVGTYCYESATANENDLKALVYTMASGLLYVSNVLATSINTTSIGSPYNAQVPFAGGASIAIGTYRFVVAATARGGSPVVLGQNGSSGPAVLLEGTDIYGSPPDPGAVFNTTTPRAWDIYVSVTPSGGGSSVLFFPPGSNRLIRSPLVRGQ